MSEQRCKALNRDGDPCASILVDEHGLCAAHREGGAERLRDAARAGGEATAAKFAAERLTAADLREINTIDDAMAAQIDIRNWVALGRLTHHAGNAMTKAVEVWMKLNAIGADHSSVARLQKTVLRLEKSEKALLQENDELRRKLATATGRIPRRTASAP